VYADGTELPNSPVLTGPGLFDGSFEIRGGYAVGWVQERVEPSTLTHIEIVDQYGEVLAREFNINPSVDLAQRSGDGYQFELELSSAAFGRGELRLAAFANGSPFHQIECRLELLGCIDRISLHHCSGWLFSPSAPQRQFELEVLHDDEIVAVASCENPRDDVQQVYATAQTPGFDVPISGIKSGGSKFTEIRIRLSGSKHDLFDSPYLVADRATAIVTARKIASLAKLRPSRFSRGDLSVLEHAISAFIAAQRQSDSFVARRQARSTRWSDASIQYSIIIPIYRGVEITRACIESVMATTSPAVARLVLINDASPEPAMAEMLSAYKDWPNILVMTNPKNLGFVKTVNRGLSLCLEGDVILLNSDTRVFAGGMNELHRAAHSSADIGTATAISNNATILSYPHPSLRCNALEDMSWEEIARVALLKNAGVTIDLPTGHGFCMLIRRELLDKIQSLDEVFGRGYGEENDFCIKGADLGFRNVAIPSVFVEHREGVSFLGETKSLLHKNLVTLGERYPEYTPQIMLAEVKDELRIGRWALDAHRLAFAVKSSTVSFVLVLSHVLGGGTNIAISDIENSIGYESSAKMGLCCREDGFIELTIESPVILAVFAPTDVDAIFEILDVAEIRVVAAHQLLGFSEQFITRFIDWVRPYHSVYYAHDFYPMCPRVTMINALDEFCDIATPDVCARCLEIGGSHESSQLSELTPAAHRNLFLRTLHAFRYIVVPSESAARYYRRAFPTIAIRVIPHPEFSTIYPAFPRNGTDDELTLLGALGKHKGSRQLFELAQRAALTHPTLRFKIIGYTDIDKALSKLGNVEITGKYEPGDLPRHFAVAKGRLALFLSRWPETYSYTLSEVVRFGFVPIVPDIGAPAERVRSSGYGVIFPFPFDAKAVLDVIDRIRDGREAIIRERSSPLSYAPGPEVIAQGREVLLKPVHEEE
jgi:GT2 family glycosyltransferase/glycosyltransferase involved in cell wall biosynthesis